MTDIKSIIGAYVVLEEGLAGWFGVYRGFDEPSFTQSDLRKAQRNEEQMLSMFKLAHKRNPLQLPEEGAFGVVDQQGKVIQASADAPEWFLNNQVCGDLKGAADFLASELNTRELFVKSYAVTFYRMRGNKGDTAYVNISPTTPQSVPALVYLSPRQKAVAQEIMAGLTISEAAKNLTISPETVRSHLKAIYSIFNVSNRVELVKALSGRKQ
ncbi:MAG: helix-turn-helix transcriptional regulator [Deltaproteobacteria bacterium]|nr:helix-turn-helix transcriptional regulator [Deltaproteobacteria bacterium]